MPGLIATLLGLSAVAVAVPPWATRVPPRMPATVTADASLPRLLGDRVPPHGRIAGAEGAPRAIVLHGGPGADPRSLLAQEGLGDAHRVPFSDQRGAGPSEGGTQDRLGEADHLADLDALIAAQGGGPVVTIGHSWGAMPAPAHLAHRPGADSRAVPI
jgi:proline iminopeptidase